MNPAFEATRSLAALPGSSEGVASRLANPDLVRYALLLAPAAALLALAAAAAVGVDALAMPGAEAIQVGLLGVCLAFLLPREFARVLRVARASAHGHIDRRTGLYNRTGFMACANEMLSRAQHEGRTLSVIVVEFNDLREVHDIYGSGISRKLIAKLVRKLSVLAGAQGLAARTGPVQFTVVLPMHRERAVRAVQRVLGKPARIEFDAGDDEIVLMPELLVGCTDAGTESMADMCSELSAELARMQKHELRRQNYLQRERERHSRPMSLPSR